MDTAPVAVIVSVSDVTLPADCQIPDKNEVAKKKSKGHRCYFCGQRFLDKNKLRKHISIHKDRDFFCDVCGKAFSANWGLRKHMKTHTGERPFQCEFCGKTFIQKCTLQLHIKALHGSKSFPRCKSCGKRMKCATDVQCWWCKYEGREIKENQNVLQLALTNKSENHADSFVEITNPEHNNEALVGSQSIDITSVNMYAKENNLHSDSNIDCNLENSSTSDKVGVFGGSCIISYPSSVEVKKHVISNNENVCAEFICDHCGLKLKDSFSMQQHLVTHPNLRPYVCQKCGKDFKKDQNLKQHMVTHKEDRPYICKLCKSAFKSIACLKQHLVSHSDERPFSCKECGSKFKSMQGLKTHVMIHSKVKPLSCKTCGKTFTFLGNLQRHFRVHTGERPYQCKSCGKRFTQSNGLKAHELTHQRPGKSVEESTCNICGKKFKSLSNFKKHMVLHDRSFV